VYRYRLADHYSELAQHYRRSSNTPKAVEYLQLAGQQAAQQSANAEAVTHLTTALELLKTLPDTPERTQQELTLHLALGAPLVAIKGYTAPEIEATYRRALELCRQGGEPAQRFPALAGLWTFYIARAEYGTTRELAEQLLTLAQSAQDPALLLGAHDALGQTFFLLGEVARAHDHCEQSLALYDPAHHHTLAALLAGEDPGVACRGYAALALWWLGYPAQALQRMHEMLTLAQELSSPYDLAFALHTVGQFHLIRQEGPAGQERAEALLALSSEQGFAYWLEAGAILRGWALAEQGRGEEGIRQIRQGLEASRATGTEVGRPHFLALLAEAYGKEGQAKEGLSVLAEALDLADKNGERYYEAELYRLKGTLTLKQSPVRGPESKVQTEAEACFLKAIEIARKQQAKSLELRAAMSLSRLWQQQDKKEEARKLLAEIYGWFTEGFDTKDLQEAKALLEQLG
jgi:predicted ATPase